MKVTAANLLALALGAAAVAEAAPINLKSFNVVEIPAYLPKSELAEHLQIGANNVERFHELQVLLNPIWRGMHGPAPIDHSHKLTRAYKSSSDLTKLTSTSAGDKTHRRTASFSGAIGPDTHTPVFLGKHPSNSKLYSYSTIERENRPEPETPLPPPKEPTCVGECLAGLQEILKPPSVRAREERKAAYEEGERLYDLDINRKPTPYELEYKQAGLDEKRKMIKEVRDLNLRLPKEVTAAKGPISPKWQAMTPEEKMKKLIELDDDPKHNKMKDPKWLADELKAINDVKWRKSRKPAWW